MFFKKLRGTLGNLSRHSGWEPPVYGQDYWKAQVYRLVFAFNFLDKKENFLPKLNSPPLQCFKLVKLTR